MQPPSYPIFNFFPLSAPAVGPIRAITSEATGVKVSLAGPQFRVLIQVSNAAPPNNVPEHLFIPPESSFDTVATVVEADPPADLMGPIRYVKVILESGVLTGGNIAESRTHGNMYGTPPQLRQELLGMINEASGNILVTPDQAQKIDEAAPLVLQAQGVLADIQASTALMEQAAGIGRVADETMLGGKPAGTYELVATNERVAWDGTNITARGPALATAAQVDAAVAPLTPIVKTLTTTTPVEQKNWRITSTYRYNELLWRLLHTDDGTVPLGAVLVQDAPGDAGVYGRDENQGHVQFGYNANAYRSLLISQQVIRCPFAVAEFEIASLPDPAAGPAWVHVGIATDGDNWVLARYNHAEKNIRVESRVRGATAVQLGDTTGVDEALQPGDFLILLVNGDCLSVLKRRGTTTKYLITQRIADQIDPRQPAIADSWRWAWGSAGQGNTPFVMRRMRAGLYGGVGLRDPKWVRDETGAVLSESGTIWFTATCAGFGTGNQPYTASHMGVFSLDTNSGQITKVGMLLSRDAGRVMGDHAGQIVYWRAKKQWLINATSFGDADIRGGDPQIRAALIDNDPRFGLWRVPMSQLNFYYNGPSGTLTSNAKWDASWILLGNKWNIAVTISDRGSHAGLWFADEATPLAPNQGSYAYREGKAREGTDIFVVGGVPRLVAGETNGAVYAYSLNPLTEVGTIDYPQVQNINGTPAQHFDVAAVTHLGQTRYLVLLFDVATIYNRTYTWGTLSVIEQGYGQEGNGYEFPITPLVL